MRIPTAIAGGLLALVGAFAHPAIANAQVDDDASTARDLAERHAPLVMVAAQDGACDPDGEPYRPMSVDLVLDNDDVLLRQAGRADPVVRRAPDAADLWGRGDGFFLDFNGLSLEPGCVYEQDFDRYAAGDRDGVATVYAHIATQEDRPGQIALQFWLYWYYNDWNNKHESDWEFIQLLFDAADLDEALAEGPVSVGYAQHEGGERSAWDDGTVQRDGDRPIVRSSRGSHASYFTSGVFLGRKGTEGFGCDTTAEDAVELDPAVELLPDSVDGPDDPYGWLAFTGRWGERGSGPFNGPTGPNTKPQWERPIDWHDDLRSASVEIPGGDQNNGTILTTFCSVVDFGSNQLRAFQVSPTRIIAFGIAATLLVRFLVMRTAWTKSAPTPLRRQRRVGQMLRTALGSYVSSRGALVAIAALYVPLALIVAVVGWAGSFSAAQAVASAMTAATSFTVTALVSAYWHLESEDHPRSLVEASRLVRERWFAIVFSLGLATAIVAVLGLTLVGLPLAVRQLVRYQFVVPVATTEGLSGRAALRRSGELVQGRWWRTACTLLVLAGIAALINSALQLGLLVALGGLPLWGYVAVTFLATGLFVPMVAAGPVLLYGDAAGVDRDQ